MILQYCSVNTKCIGEEEEEKKNARPEKTSRAGAIDRRCDPQRHGSDLEHTAPTPPHANTDTRHSTLGRGYATQQASQPRPPLVLIAQGRRLDLISSSLINEVVSTIGRVSRPSDVLAVLDCESPRPYARAIARSFRVKVRVGVAHRFPWHPCIARHGLHLPGPSEQQQRPPHSRAARDLLLLGNVQ